MKATITKTRIIFDEEVTEKFDLWKKCVTEVWSSKNEGYVYLKISDFLCGYLFSHLKNRSYCFLRTFLEEVKLGTRINCDVRVMGEIIRIKVK